MEELAVGLRIRTIAEMWRTDSTVIEEKIDA